MPEINNEIPTIASILDENVIVEAWDVHVREGVLLDFLQVKAESNPEIAEEFREYLRLCVEEMQRCGSSDFKEDNVE